VFYLNNTSWKLETSNGENTGKVVNYCRVNEPVKRVRHTHTRTYIYYVFGHSMTAFVDS